MPGQILKQKRLDRGMAVLRVITGLLMAYHGMEVFSTEKMEMYMGWNAVQQLPAGKLLVYLGKGGEFVTGILLILGFFTKWASLIMACIMFFICFFIGKGRFWYEDQHAFVFALLALVFVIYGPGAWALDHKISKK
jgi:putative oxidoreductase